MVDENGSVMEISNTNSEIPVIMGSKEHEMIELFRKINISRPIALTLASLAKGGEVSSRTIETLSGLRQPEVSIAIKYLRENNWISVREEKKSKSKGRPIKLYRLIVPMDCIISKIEEEIIAENRIMLRNIERLKNLA